MAGETTTDRSSTPTDRVSGKVGEEGGETAARGEVGNNSCSSLAPKRASVNNLITMGFREITAPVYSESTVHRVERVPEWLTSEEGPQWRALCGVRIGEAGRGGVFEFEVPVALDPESWRLAANCPACLAATERRELGALG